jgi:hypothetical protein
MPPATALAQPSAAVQPGYPQAAPLPPAVFAYAPPTNGMAVASLVFGIVSWFICPFVGGLLAVIFGHVARGQIRRTGAGGGGLAIAGLILGYFHLAAAIVVGFIWLVLLGGVLSTLGTLGNVPSPSP